ncbi:putative lipoprotein [Hyphomonas polymorpha PS728]|uniref:Putative lipoprotein n=1 Tax=Hyphomonas polymorpha PS728 TaxID=1280954 RepID=A0A062VJ21_9PROT|nr:energy transducer TonB [Hyphomonas polymorpha]KCZ98081.1 putative lipoprotein [Hyphomonas polymorpha PS728]
MNRLTLLIAAGLAVAGCATQEALAPELAAVCPVPAMPLVFPHPYYPEAEAQNGYEDRCTVRFDVGAAGTPENVTARCTYKAFADSAEAAMQDARFDPALSKALPQGAQCAGFNFEYSLEPLPEAS